MLSLAQFDHVAIKVSGACTLAHEPFPYPDIWEPLGRVFEAFGFDRCMWGTDWTRAVNLLTYEQGVEAFRVTDQLSDGERAALMGGTLERIYGWSPGAAAVGRPRWKQACVSEPWWEWLPVPVAYLTVTVSTKTPLAFSFPTTM